MLRLKSQHLHPNTFATTCRPAVQSLTMLVTSTCKLLLLGNLVGDPIKPSNFERCCCLNALGRTVWKPPCSWKHGTLCSTARRSPFDCQEFEHVAVADGQRTVRGDSSCCTSPSLEGSREDAMPADDGTSELM